MNASLLTETILYFAMMQSAKAEEEPFSFGVSPQQYANFGMTSGVSLDSKLSTDSLRPGIYSGLEGSYIRVKDKLWTGVYADAVYDFGQGAAAVTAGPRIGFLMTGFDVGLGLRAGAMEKAELGMQARTMVTLGWFCGYYRYGGWWSEDSLADSHQVGVILKMPFALSYDARPINP